MAGIVGYGAYIPVYRIKSEEIAAVWGEDAERISKGLGILEKAVGGPDEDAATIAVEAARLALKRASIDGREIGAVYIGSESHPYAVKPTATIVAEAVGATPLMTAADLEFACKAGTAGLQAAAGLVDSGYIKYALIAGADTAQGRPGDALEYSAASGGAAFVIGPSQESVAILEKTLSFTTDTPDFWRRPKADYPMHGGRFTGKPAYFKHVINATTMLLEEMGREISDYDYVVFHQPNARFPKEAAKRLGVREEQLLPGLLVPYVGNTYSGASLLGLAAVLDVAEPGQLVLVTSYGSGAGSDSFSFKITDKIEEVRERGVKVKEMLERKRYISYATYVKFRNKLKM